MATRPSSRPLLREKFAQIGALGYLLALGGLTLAGPYGMLAWGEDLSLLHNRQAQIASLTADRDRLSNRVALLDPDHADPDLVTELMRQDLNVAHPDEYIIELNYPNGR